MSEIAVIGAGTMGHALALVFALGGHGVRYTDADPATLARAPGLMARALSILADAGEVDPGWTAERLHRAARPCASVAETVAGAEVVIEAIIEQPEAKRTLFAELDRLMAADAILASNTSYLDVFPLVPQARQNRTLIAHWYTPPYLIDLVDIVAGPHTEPAVVAQLHDMVVAMGKTPVVLRRFVSGYIANRLQSALTLEVNRLIDEGYASPEEIDASIIHGLALRLPILGQCAKMDFTGLKLMQTVLANRTYEPPTVIDRRDAPDRLLAQGRSGVMAGAGYFDWAGRSPEDLFEERDRKLLALKQALRRIGPMHGV